MPPVIDVTPTEEDPDDVAARGTRIHEARATGNTINLRDETELEAYRNWNRLEWSVIRQWTEDNNIGPGIMEEAVCEERFWLHHPQHLHPLLSGQLDSFYLAGREGLIIDGKTSWAYYVKRVRESWQAKIYVLLLWKEFPQLERIRFAFIKPELKYGAQIDYADFTRYDFENIERYVLQKLWEMEQPDAPLQAGPHCIFCPARGICEAAARYAMLPSIARRSFEPGTAELVARLTPAQAVGIWQNSGAIVKILEAVVGRLKSLPADELEELGLKLTDGARNDYVRDTQAAFNFLKEQGIDEAALFTALDFNKGRLIDLFRQQMSMTKQMAEHYFERDLDEFIERARKKPSLVEL